MLLALKSGGTHAEKTPPESLSGIQIESRVSGHQGRQDGRGAGAAVRCAPESDHLVEVTTSETSGRCFREQRTKGSAADRHQGTAREDRRPHVGK